MASTVHASEFLRKWYKIVEWVQLIFKRITELGLKNHWTHSYGLGNLFTSNYQVILSVLTVSIWRQANFTDTWSIRTSSTAVDNNRTSWLRKLWQEGTELWVVERSVAYHLGQMKRAFEIGELDENMVANMDETFFVCDMDDGRVRVKKDRKWNTRTLLWILRQWQ